MIVDTGSFIREALPPGARGPVLVMAYSLPPEFFPFVEGGGELHFFGAAPPPEPLASRLAGQCIEPLDRDLLGALERRAKEGRLGSFALIHLDHHRGTDRLVRAINALLRGSDEHTVFLFPGALPPEPALTGTSPGHPWWAGETWLLPRVLRPAGSSFTVLASTAWPLGLLLARDFQPLEAADFEEARARAAGELADPARFLAAQPRRPLSAFLEALGTRRQAPGEAPTPDWVEVNWDHVEPDVRSSETLETLGYWSRPDPAFVLDLSGRDLDTSLLFCSRRWRQGNRIDRFERVEVLGRDVLLGGGERPSERRFYGKYVLADGAVRGLDLAARSEDPHDSSSAVVRRNETFFYPRRKLDGAITLDAPVFFATPDEPLNWGMWMLHVVPAAFHYRRYAADYPRFLCCMTQGWQRPLLQELGVPDGALVPHRMDAVHSARDLAALRQSFRGMVVRDSDREAFDELGGRWEGRAPSPERLYVSRRGLDHYRVLVNEDALEAALERRGFVAIRPQILPFPEQVRLFRNARVVVGLGGAGLFNTVFCRPGARVVTIESSMMWVDLHANLFASSGAEYGVIFGAQDPTDPHPYQKRWSVDVARAVAAIEAFAG